jgi:hypothetical protein
MDRPLYTDRPATPADQWVFEPGAHPDPTPEEWAAALASTNACITRFKQAAKVARATVASTPVRQHEPGLRTVAHLFGPWWADLFAYAVEEARAARMLRRLQTTRPQHDRPTRTPRRLEHSTRVSATGGGGPPSDSTSDPTTTMPAAIPAAGLFAARTHLVITRSGVPDLRRQLSAIQVLLEDEATT